MYSSTPYIDELQRAAGAARRGLEAAVGRDRVVGEDPAVAPAADPEPVRIRDADLLHVIHRAEQIDDFLVAPVGEDRLLVGAAPPVAATVVHRHDDVAVGRKQLPLEAERVLVLAVRAAVDAQQRRVFLPLRCRSRGLTISPCTSVPSLLVDVNSSVVPSRSFDSHVVVLVRQPAQLAVLERRDLRQLGVRGRQDRERAVGAGRQVGDDALRAADERARPAGRRARRASARRILRAVVLDQEGERWSRPSDHGWRSAPAIERFRVERGWPPAAGMTASLFWV